MKRKRLAHIVLIVAAGFSTLSVSCRRLIRGEEAAAPVTVKVMWVNTRQDLRNTSYVGTVSPAKSAVLFSRYPGPLERLYVKQGDYVEKGQPVAKISSATVQSSFDMAVATLRQAEDGYNRMIQVYEAGGVPDVKRVEVEAQLDKARAAAEAAKSSLNDCVIKAPFSGIIGDVYTDEGVNLSLSEPIARIMDISEIEIRFPVPEKEIAKVKPGDDCLFTLPAVEGELCPGKIKTKGMVASSLSHSYECSLQPLRKVENLLPGMVCKVYLTGEMREGIVVAATVVQMDADGKYVWVVNDENVVEKRYVSVGGFCGKGVIITDGLNEGDGLIVEGSRKVSTGMRVEVTDE